MSDSLRIRWNEKKSNIISSIIVMLLFCVAHVSLFLLHEAWRDESQAWVLVRNSSFGDLFKICASEGHPVLWFLILYPFTRMGFSFYNFSYISIFFMTIAVGIWMYKAPFSLLTKLSVVVSPIFFYYNPVICRIYAVLVLLFICIACMWEKRFQHPILYGILIALFIQSHVLVIGVALGLLLDMMLETVVNYKRARLTLSNMIGLMIPVVSLICFFFELRQRGGEEFFIKISTASLLQHLTLSNILGGIISVSNKFGKWLGLAVLTGLFLISFSTIYNSAKNKVFSSHIREFMTMLCGFSAYWGIIILVRKADHVQMAIVFWMIVLFCCWIYTANDENNVYRYLDWAIGIICVLSALFCVSKDVIYDVCGFYSGSKEIVKQINDNVPEQSVLIFVNNARSTSPYAYLAESENQYYFWDIDNAQEYSVHIWGKKKKRDIAKDDIPKYAKRDFNGDTRDLYYVSSEKLDPQCDNAIICANTKPDKWNETYWVYDLKCIEPMDYQSSDERIK